MLTHVIDLTNTYKYYDPGQLPQNFMYYKFKIQGKKIPERGMVDEIFSIINST